MKEKACGLWGDKKSKKQKRGGGKKREIKHIPMKIVSSTRR